jgi:hypothetical protein
MKLVDIKAFDDNTKIMLDDAIVTVGLYICE